MIYGPLVEYRALITFSSLTQAMEAESVLKRLNCPFASIPTPQSVRSGCNTALCFPLEHREIVEDLIENGVVFLGAYKVTEEGLTTLW